MDQKKYEKAITALIKAKLGSSLRGIMDEAEIAWSLQREAISLIDYKNDAVQGEEKLEELIDSLNIWIIRLEVLENDAKKVAKRAHQAIHARGRDVEPEEDSQGYGSLDPGLQELEAFDKGVEKELSGNRGGGRRHAGRRASGHRGGGRSQVVGEGIEKDFNESRKVPCGEF
jgi:hypothetical protein